MAGIHCFVLQPVAAALTSYGLSSSTKCRACLRMRGFVEKAVRRLSVVCGYSAVRHLFNAVYVCC